jgi:Flp pilus assembly protein TadG
MTRSMISRRWGGLRRDRGSVAVESALAVPMIVLILLTLLQVFGWAMGSLAAHNAADHAAQTARQVGGSAAAGRADAQAILAQLVGSFITNPTVTVTRTAVTTTVTITGHARGVPVPITVTVTAPTERYTTPS